MIKALVSDFSRVILSPVEEDYAGGLNALHQELSAGGDYNFWDYFKLNEDLINFYKKISEQTTMYVFTSEYIQEHPALQPKIKECFKEVFSAARLGLKKTDPETYKIIANKILLKPEDVLYIDDKQTNLDAAAQAGMKTIRFESNLQVERDIIKTLKMFDSKK